MESEEGQVDELTLQVLRIRDFGCQEPHFSEEIHFASNADEQLVSFCI